MKHRKALIIIDMQKACFTPLTPRFDAEGIVNRINTLSAKFRRAKFPVIFIQHDGSGTGMFEKNTIEREILDELDVDPNDIRIDKYVNDVFYKTELQSKLTELNVKDLYITGCASDFCVESSIQSGLTRDYNITVVSDGHTTGDSPHLQAQEIIDHYNWVWHNMIPTKGKIEVKTLQQIKIDLTTHQA